MILCLYDFNFFYYLLTNGLKPEEVQNIMAVCTIMIRIIFVVDSLI